MGDARSMDRPQKIKRKDGRYGVRYSATSTEALCAMALALVREVSDDF